ncbi:MAG: cobalt transporter [Deltaproteobacteria bacterium]|nr:MAG: cobalt transporter [Deltaproteobacteria bacterium]PIE74912.1 MAG: cobalt transporter [Deltaproteobacteria bacterium]
MRVSSGINFESSESFVEKLDVRTKILICFAASMDVIFLKSPVSLGFLCCLSIIYAMNIGRFKIIFICYGALSIMWMVAIGFMYLMHLISSRIPVTGPEMMLVPFLRTAIMINTVLALALSSRIQTLLESLKTLKLPIWLYIPAAVMIRFVPTFIKDVQQIHETMKIRGYGLNPLFILKNPLFSVRLLIAPVLFRALKSSDDLGIAAELKGVGYDSSMGNFKPQFFKNSDVIILFLTAIILALAGIIELNWGVENTGVF